MTEILPSKPLVLPELVPIVDIPNLGQQIDTVLSAIPAGKQGALLQLITIEAGKLSSQTAIGYKINNVWSVGAMGTIPFTDIKKARFQVVVKAVW